MVSGLGLEATELRLGLPGAGGEGEGAKKRGYEETIDLKLQLQTPADSKEPEEAADNMIKKTPSVTNVAQCGSVVGPEKPPASKYD